MRSFNFYPCEPFILRWCDEQLGIQCVNICTHSNVQRRQRQTLVYRSSEKSLLRTEPSQIAADARLSFICWIHRLKTVNNSLGIKQMIKLHMNAGINEKNIKIFHKKCAMTDTFLEDSLIDDPLIGLAAAKHSDGTYYWLTWTANQDQSRHQQQVGMFSMKDTFYTTSRINPCK